MAKFISDDEMSALEGSRPAEKHFISDEDMAKHELEPSWTDKAKEFFTGKDYDWSNLPKDLAQGQVDALPAYAGAAGSVVGLGNPAITGAFTAAGDSLKNGINSTVDSLKRGTFLDDNLRLPTANEVAQVTNKAVDSFNSGAMSEMLGQSVAGAPNALRNLKVDANNVGQSLRKTAGEFAENATGATGVQASKFRPGAGNELLDRGLLKFGDNAKNIAGRVSSAMESAHADIDDVLKTLDEKGITVSADNVVSELQNRISSLQKDPSQAGIVRKLKGIVDDIIETGESNIPISLAEQTKRGFNKQAGNWMEPEVGEAGKTAYQAYRGAVEDSATSADEALAEKFLSAKKTHGLLAPIQEAAERRARTTNQSPIGGFLDMATTATGGAVGGTPVGAAAAIGRRVLAPRVSSSVAVTLNKVSKSLMSSPQMAELAQKSPDVFQALVYQLGNKMNSTMELQKAAGQKRDSGERQSEDQSKKPGASIDKDQLLRKTQGSKYGQVLQNAAARGDDAFNAAHFVLSSRDEGYRKQLENDQG